MRLVIIGYGFSSKAIHRALDGQLESLTVTTTKSDKADQLKAQGVNAVTFDGTSVSAELDEALRSATHLIVSAAPTDGGDPLLKCFDVANAHDLTWVGYLSTVGVYGDHGGVWIDETTPATPASARSKARRAVEATWEQRQTVFGFELGTFRLAGIYGAGRSALDKVRSGTARRIVKPGQVFNRIHVDDIGRAVAEAAIKKVGGIFNVCDDEPGPPQDVITHAANLLDVEPPPEVAFEESNLSPMGRFFYGENKRVSNARLKEAFGPMLYPTYRQGLAGLLAGEGKPS
ncbi:MAG: SDR family oxidoreductase [Cohaesibacteraceae bacterium]